MDALKALQFRSHNLSFPSQVSPNTLHDKLPHVYNERDIFPLVPVMLNGDVLVFRPNDVPAVLRQEYTDKKEKKRKEEERKKRKPRAFCFLFFFLSFFFFFEPISSRSSQTMTKVRRRTASAQCLGVLYVGPGAGQLGAEHSQSPLQQARRPVTFRGKWE